jgi:hypothetical protein
MPSWITSLVFAVLVVTIPFTLILRIMLRLPKALALSHRPWPLPLNFALIGAVTLYVTIFIRSAYYGRASEPVAVMLQFLIAALAYVFGLVLLLRQFAGLYPEYIVTTGPTGLSMRKTVYRKVTDVVETARSGGESRLRIQTIDGKALSLALSARDVSVLFERLRCG